jgi:hypothetical protein
MAARQNAQNDRFADDLLVNRLGIYGQGILPAVSLRPAGEAAVVGDHKIETKRRAKKWKKWLRPIQKLKAR